VRHAPRSAWLGARWALGAAGAEAALLTGFTGALLAACLLALQRAPAPDAAGAQPEALAALQGALERVRPEALPQPDHEPHNCTASRGRSDLRMCLAPRQCHARRRQRGGAATVGGRQVLVGLLAAP